MLRHVGTGSFAFELTQLEDSVKIYRYIVIFGRKLIGGGRSRAQKNQKKPDR